MDAIALLQIAEEARPTKITDMPAIFTFQTTDTTISKRPASDTRKPVTPRPFGIRLAHLPSPILRFHPAYNLGPLYG